MLVLERCGAPRRFWCIRTNKSASSARPLALCNKQCHQCLPDMRRCCACCWCDTRACQRCYVHLITGIYLCVQSYFNFHRHFIDLQCSRPFLVCLADWFVSLLSLSKLSCVTHPEGPDQKLLIKV